MAADQTACSAGYIPGDTRQGTFSGGCDRAAWPSTYLGLPKPGRSAVAKRKDELPGVRAVEEFEQRFREVANVTVFDLLV